MGDFSKIILGEGKLFADYGETGEADLGYVRGATFNENLTVRHIQVDGKKGNVAGDAIVETVDPTLEVVMMEINSENMIKTFTGINSDTVTTVTTLTRSLTMESADYLTNISFVGQTKAGTDIVVKLLKASGEGSVNMAFADKSEVEMPLVFHGNYTSTEDTTAPYEIIIDETV